MAEEKNPDPQLIDPSKTTFISKNTFGSSVHLNRRASIASFHHIRDNPRKWDKNVRRYSTILKPDFSNVSNFIVPHYLRASMGSCHDICKYGRRHSCEEKPKKHPIKITSPSIKQKKEKVFKNHPSVDTKKTSHSLKPFIVSKYNSPKRAPSSGPALQNDVSKCYWPKPKTPSGDRTHNVPRQRYVVKKSFVVSKCSSPKQTPPSGATTSFPRQNGPFSNNKTRFSPNSTSRKSFSSSPPEVIKREILSPVKKVKSPVRGINSNDKKMSRMVRKSKPVSSCKNSDGKTGQKNDGKNGTLSAKNPLVPRVAMLPPKTSVTKKPFLKARKGGALKSLPPTKDQNGRSNGRDSVRKLYVIKSSETKKSPSSLLREKIESRNGNELDEIVCDKIISIDIVKVQPVKDDQKYDEIGELQPVKQNQDKNEEMGTQNKNAEDSASGGLEKAPVLLSDDKTDDKKMIQCSCDEATDVEIVKVQPVNAESSASLPHEVDSKVQPAKENHNKTQRRGKSVISQDKYSTPLKLKFRSGKIIELQNDDNNFPRRLRFRRSSRINNDTKDDFAPDNKKSLLSRKSRVVVSEDKYISPTKLMRSSERFVHPITEDNPPRRLRFGRPRFVVADQNGKNDDFFRRRSFKRSGSKDDLAGCEFSSRRFILKHRNSWQRKEDNRVLFNNVIEETASKLVNSRKSKVKALVGAFETVISLQER